MKRVAFGSITLGFLALSMIADWPFGGFTFIDDAREKGPAVELTPYLMMMGRDTFESRQSGFLQLLWQVVGLGYFLFVASPLSRKRDDRIEGQPDGLTPWGGEAIIREIDESHERRGGRASIQADRLFNA